MKTAIRAYSLLLKFYPRQFRKEFGVQMIQTFRDHYNDLEKSGGHVGMSFWFMAVTDEVRNIARQRLAFLTEGNHFLKMSVGKLVLSALLVLPLYGIFCASMVKISLTLPHPPLSGIFAIIAMATVAVILPGILSVVLSYTLASAFVSILPKRL